MDSGLERPARRKSNAEATRRALLGAARRLFGTHGFEKASLSEICKDAGATTGSLYHHFGDKAGLFQAVFEEIDREAIEICGGAFARRVAETGGDIWEGMAAAHAAAIEVGTDPGKRQIFFRDAPTVLGTNWLDVHERNGYGAMIGVVQQMQEAGLMIDGCARRLALMIENLVFAAVQTMPEDVEEARRVLPDAQRSARAMLDGLRIRKAKAQI